MKNNQLTKFNEKILEKLPNGVIGFIARLILMFFYSVFILVLLFLLGIKTVKNWIVSI